MSRDKILAAIRQNQPALKPLPSLSGLNQCTFEAKEQYKNVLKSIGGHIVEVDNETEIVQYIRENYTQGHRFITTLPQFAPIAETNWSDNDPHDLENVELMLMAGTFGVAENSAIWVTEGGLGQRVAPFICQNLAIVLNAHDIVPTMHEAYERIGSADYGFGVFIAGPSKTADIEQSLVLGAHGARTLVVFLVNGA
ncbi:MAG: LUD domain-containing protein [Saprospiraceae bacterium]|nr:LUD domain-containing protein [Saprospiraceae bacterium]